MSIYLLPGHRQTLAPPCVCAVLERFRVTGALRRRGHLGHIDPEDGFRFRGRAMVQLTGKDSDARATTFLCTHGVAMSAFTRLLDGGAVGMGAPIRWYRRTRAIRSWARRPVEHSCPVCVT